VVAACSNIVPIGRQQQMPYGPSDRPSAASIGRRSDAVVVFNSAAVKTRSFAIKKINNGD